MRASNRSSPRYSGRDGLVEPRVGREDIDQRQMMTLAHLVIVEIVRGRDLDAAAAELRIDVAVGDDGNLALGERQPKPAADQVAVALIVGMHRDGGVAQHRFRTRRRDHDVAIGIDEWIAQVPQVAVFFRGDDLEIRECGLQHRVPVHQTLAAVDELVLEQPHEHFGDRARELRIHGEAVAAPIDRGTEPAHLAGDDAARLLLPFPHPLDEGGASEIGAARALGVELPLDHQLRGDAGVVGPGLPERIEAPHPVIADEGVHDRVLERMPHVQRPRDVRRRDDDGVGRAAAARPKVSGLFPELVGARFDVARRIGLIHGTHRLRRGTGGSRAPAWRRGTP